MDSTQLKRSMACCGLVCSLCFNAASMCGLPGGRVPMPPAPPRTGTASTAIAAGNATCKGCWECHRPEGLLRRLVRPGLLPPRSRPSPPSSRRRAWTAFIAEVQAGRAHGLKIEKGGDYDGIPEAAVWKLLKGHASS